MSTIHACLKEGRSIEDIHEELVAARIVQQPQDVSLAHFVGGAASTSAPQPMAGGGSSDMPPRPTSLAHVRHMVANYCLLPLANAVLHAKSAFPLLDSTCMTCKSYHPIIVHSANPAAPVTHAACVYAVPYSPRRTRYPVAADLALEGQSVHGQSSSSPACERDHA